MIYLILKGYHIVACVLGTRRVRPNTIIPLGYTWCIPTMGKTINGNGLNQDASQPEYMIFLRERN